MQIDLGSIGNEKQLHELLSEYLSFPKYYGMNWDAFWDCLTDSVELPETIEFLNTHVLLARLPKSFEQLKSCFLDLERECSAINCNVTWS